MGINLAPVSYYATEQPFMNAFLSSEGWVTHSDSNWNTDEERFLNLDANGWPVTLKSVNEPSPQQFNSLGVTFLLGMPVTPSGTYPGGSYVVLYEGQGTLSYGLDATLVSRAPGRDVVRVAASHDGIELRIVATDPNHTGNYLRNIQFVAATNEAAVKSGKLFNPTFLELMKNFRALRFMDWFQTNDSVLSSWSDRPTPANAFFGTRKGIPIEMAVQLTNAVSADAWMNVPIKADDDYIVNMARLVHALLGNTQKLYVELSNEVWNGTFSQYRYAANRGRALWPTQPGGNDGFEYNREWFGMRTAQMCDLWKSVWGPDPRLVCVLGAQAAWSYSAIASLKCPYWTTGAPCSNHAISAVAIAPYMGEALPSKVTTLPDGGLSALFASLYPPTDPPEDQSHLSQVSKWWRQAGKQADTGGFIGQVSSWTHEYIKTLASYHLPLLAYEGGQNFAFGSTDDLNSLYMAANRDPRMTPALSLYFQQWKAGGGQLFMYYNDVGIESKYGSWGAIESIMQTTVPLNSAPPKWQAIQTFIAQNPCWWSNCSGAVAAGN